MMTLETLWRGVCKWSIKAGREATRQVLLLWFVMKSPDTPRKDRLALFASIAYLVFPVDIVDSKRLPIIGWFDEIMSIVIAYDKMQKHITPEMRARADRIVSEWFPVYNGYVDYERVD